MSTVRLAPVALLLGLAATFTVDQVVLHRWARSGVRVPLGPPTSVRLPAGDVVVFYESADTVPTGEVQLAIANERDELVMHRPPEDDQSFRMLIDGWSGRALWVYDDLEAGVYDVMAASDAHYPDKPPSGDRIVFAKRPATLDAARARRRVIQITGIALSIAAAATVAVLGRPT